MGINSVIAQNLKRLRTERNLSLGQLAEAAGISKVMLSQIEKGDANPTINTIWKIAAGLKVPYTALLDKREESVRVITRADVPVQQDEEGRYRILCYYSSTPERNFEWFCLELDAGHSYTSVGHPERAQEYIMVTEGALVMEIDGTPYRLNAEDSLLFEASFSHSYRNDGDVLTKAIIINYYPA